MVDDSLGGRPFRQSNHRLLYIVPLFFVPISTVTAWAQLARPHTPTSSLDSYGDAVPNYVDRRAITGEITATQRLYTGIYPERVRRRDQRLGRSGLLLPWEIQPYRPVQPTNPIDPLSQPYLSSTRRRAFSEYGGFERRSTVPMEEGAIAALTRRHRLIEATTLNAPVYRALDQTVGTGSPRPVLEVVPTIGPLVTPIASPVPAVHPDQFLREGMDKAGTRAKEDARAWFQRGHYRQAARAFETAALMNPSDGEALIGQVFCYFSVGAARTALVLLREIAREDADPFRYALNPTTFYGSPDELRRVRVEIQFLAEAAKGSDDLAALRALLLWYFGDRHEAAVVAAAIHRDFPASPFANWVSRMREGSPDRAGSDGAPE